MTIHALKSSKGLEEAMKLLTENVQLRLDLPS